MLQVISIEASDMEYLSMAEWVSDEDDAYAHNLVAKICTEAGPGVPGSNAERARANIVQDAMAQIVDEVAEEEFTMHPRAFLGWFTLGVFLALISLLFYYLSDLPFGQIVFISIAFGIATFILLMLIFEFLLYREFVDFLFPKATSENVVGRILPESGEEPTRLIIFSGHHDSAWQFTWLRYLKHGYYISEAVLIFGVLSLFLGCTVKLVSILANLPYPPWIAAYLVIVSWVLLPAGFVFGVFFTERGASGTVPGATDNLSGTTCALAMGRIVKNHPEIVPANTEIRIVSFGSEEAGCRGSTRYVARHLAELRAKDAVIINFETIAQPEISILTSDSNGFVHNSKEIVDHVAAAAEASGTPHIVHPFFFGGGGTDSLPFSRAGIKSACLVGMKVPGQMLQFYHQDRDTPDKLNDEALKNALKIATEYLRSL